MGHEPYSDYPADMTLADARLKAAEDLRLLREKERKRLEEKVAPVRARWEQEDRDYAKSCGITYELFLQITARNERLDEERMEEMDHVY